MYCPRPIADLYNERLNVTRAPHIDYAQAVPSSYYINSEACLRINYATCNLCAQICTAHAIDFGQTPKELNLDIGAVVLTPGFGRIDRSVLERYGYGCFPDVVTSMEFERLTCSSGPTEGRIVRLSDNKTPKKIAFLQCIGSRDETCGNSYCSSVCCMYAIKEASVAREHIPDLDISLFFMDVRTQGKGFDEARRQIQKKYGLRIIRARIPRVEQLDGQLALTWTTEEGKSSSELFDMVVLSEGLNSPEDAKTIAKILGIELNSHEFCKTSIVSPLATTCEGVYVAGAFQGPKDIPESVTQASGVAAMVSELLSDVRNSRTVKISYPEENKAIESRPPQIGVFVCNCGSNIAGVVDVKAVRDYASTLPGVTFCQDTLYSCSPDALKGIADAIKENQLNRVVIAACSPRTHQPLFQETLKSIGLNPALIEMANIRDQCSWVHSQEPEAATQKAKDLIRMAVAKAKLLEPLEQTNVDVFPSALVIGGGAAGMTAALSIAEQGFECVLVERTDSLGGNLKRLFWTMDGEKASKILDDLIKQVETHPRIKIMLQSQVENISGYVGNFISSILNGKEVVEFKHGVIVIATGGREYSPKSYKYGQNSQVITQLELEQGLANGKNILKDIKNVVMIQCAGSRGDDLSYCSRLCCTQAVKNSLKLREIDPKLRIYCLYRDMRTYGFYEDLFQKARKKGVIFIRYELNRKPQVIEQDGKIKVKVFDRLLDEEIDISECLVVLSVGIVPAENKALAKILKTPLTPEGFFLEAHVKLKPVELAVEGVYLCGLAHGPKPVDESIAQAKAAAAKAVIPLSKGQVPVAPIVSRVNQDICIGCGICESLCPFNAIRLFKVNKRRKAKTITASCKGCGICAAHCPTIAISMGGFTDEAIMAQIHAFAEERSI
jgi:heterodisulfide reductase subunit A